MKIIGTWVKNDEFNSDQCESGRNCSPVVLLEHALKLAIGSAVKTPNPMNALQINTMLAGIIMKWVFMTKSLHVHLLISLETRNMRRSAARSTTLDGMAFPCATSGRPARSSAPSMCRFVQVTVLQSVAEPAVCRSLCNWPKTHQRSNQTQLASQV